MVDLNELHVELHTQMLATQHHYQGPADCCRNPAPDFCIGQKVFVNVNHIHTTRPSKKLSEEYLGPYKIIAQPGTHSFTLQLPKHMRAIHPIFLVSQLELETPNQIPNHMQPMPPPIEIGDELEYKIAEILDSKIDNRCKCKLLYYICWTGYKGTDKEYSWLPATELTRSCTGTCFQLSCALPTQTRPSPAMKFFLFHLILT